MTAKSVNLLFDSAAAFASGTITFTGNPLNKDTITIAGKTYTFVTALNNVDADVNVNAPLQDIDGYIPIGDNSYYTLKNLYLAINASSENQGKGPGINYSEATTANSDVTAGPPNSPAPGDSGILITVTATTAGTSGNSLTLAKNSTKITLSGATLTGGTSTTQSDGAGIITGWYGGPITIEAGGTFDGATVTINVCTRAPADLTTLTDADWVELTNFSAAGTYSDILNPCLLNGVISSAGGSTSVRVSALPT